VMTLRAACLQYNNGKNVLFDCKPNVRAKNEVALTVFEQGGEGEEDKFLSTLRWDDVGMNGHVYLKSGLVVDFDFEKYTDTVLDYYHERKNLEKIYQDKRFTFEDYFSDEHHWGREKIHVMFMYCIKGHAFHVYDVTSVPQKFVNVVGTDELCLRDKIFVTRLMCGEGIAEGVHRPWPEMLQNGSFSEFNKVWNETNESEVWVSKKETGNAVFDCCLDKLRVKSSKDCLDKLRANKRCVENVIPACGPQWLDFGKKGGGKKVFVSDHFSILDENGEVDDEIVKVGDEDFLTLKNEWLQDCRKFKVLTMQLLKNGCNVCTESMPYFYGGNHTLFRKGAKGVCGERGHGDKKDVQIVGLPNSAKSYFKPVFWKCEDVTVDDVMRPFVMERRYAGIQWRGVGVVQQVKMYKTYHGSDFSLCKESPHDAYAKSIASMLKNLTQLEPPELLFVLSKWVNRVHEKMMACKCLSLHALIDFCDFVHELTEVHSNYSTSSRRWNIDTDTMPFCFLMCAAQRMNGFSWIKAGFCQTVSVELDVFFYYDEQLKVNYVDEFCACDEDE